MMLLIIALVLSYLLGSVPASYLVARLTKGIDIRRYGSGNVGATNVLRTAGKKAAAVALGFDILKGVLAVTALSALFGKAGSAITRESFNILMGFSVICGHIWPVFLSFKGGKGIATSTGVLIVLCPKAVLIAGAVWLISIIITRYVSLASVMASITLPVVTAIMGRSIQMVIFTITLCFISTYKHKSNIIRLINGEEPKIGEKTKIE